MMLLLLLELLLERLIAFVLLIFKLKLLLLDTIVNQIKIVIWYYLSILTIIIRVITSIISVIVILNRLELGLWWVTIEWY